MTFSLSRVNAAWISGEYVFVKARYSAAFVEDCRNIEGRRWHHEQKLNSFPLEAAPALRALGKKWNIPMPAEIVGNTVVPSTFHAKDEVRLEDGKIVIAFNYDPKKIDQVKVQIPNVTWSNKKSVWEANLSDTREVVNFALNFGISMSQEFTLHMTKLFSQQQAMIDSSLALDADIEIPNINGELLPYQKAGVAYLIKARKAILGDQPGLGKTVQAIATVATENAFPAVVVCPNTLKLNWKREISKFFPHLNVQVLTGTKSVPIPTCDVVVMNYDISYERIPDVVAHGYKSLIVDESHAIKNGKRRHVCPKCEAQVRSNSKNCSACKATNIVPFERWTVKRTAAVMQLAKRLSDNDFVLLLTGTPITNRPEELIPQLEAINRLKDFGGSWRFKERYAPSKNVANNTKELNNKLRSTCFVRRVKKDVYAELPELRNAVQFLEINETQTKWYQSVEHDVVEYFANRAKELAQESGENGDNIYWEKKIRLEAARHLIQITGLRDAVSKIKYDSITSWLDNFLESSSDEKVIVFAEHIEFVEKLHARYADKAVKIRGGVSVADRQNAVDRFQTDPTCRVFVANMTAASEGLTLTAASDVVFCELGWTPAIHEQCASRAYGRANDLHGATAWYLLAPDTIDEDIYSLLEKKRRIVDAVTDGIDVEDEGSVMGGLIVALAKRGMNEGFTNDEVLG